MSREFRSNNNVVYSCIYHVIWCPKYRRKVLVGQVETRLKQIISEVAQKFQCEIQEMEVMPDHVHLVVEVDLVGVNYFCRLTTIIFAGSPLSFFGRSCCRDCVAGLLRCGSWAH